MTLFVRSRSISSVTMDFFNVVEGVTLEDREEGLGGSSTKLKLGLGVRTRARLELL